jgi:HSP20 family protein
MGILRKEPNQNQLRRRGDQNQNAIVRSDQSQLARDPFQAFARDPFQMMREMMIDPFRAFQQMAPWGELGRDRMELGWSPSFEVRETDDAILLKGDMPGLKKEDVDISLVGNTLQISGKRDREEEHVEGTVHTYERSYGEFSRSFALPDSAELDKISCELKDGVLTLVVPKKAESAPQRRKVQIGSGSKS